jgi:hypothetical protein
VSEGREKQRAWARAEDSTEIGVVEWIRGGYRWRGVSVETSSGGDVQRVNAGWEAGRRVACRRAAMRTRRVRTRSVQTRSVQTRNGATVMRSVHR